PARFKTPASNTATMLGCCSAAAVRASRSKRAMTRFCTPGYPHCAAEAAPIPAHAAWIRAARAGHLGAASGLGGLDGAGAGRVGDGAAGRGTDCWAPPTARRKEEEGMKDRTA